MSSIGVFDSGFGGLMILKHLVKVMPQYDFVYLGDSARVPYGPRSSEEVCHFTEQAMDFLLQKQNCDLVIIACNTASSDALRKIQQEYLLTQERHKRVLGVITPACEEAFSLTQNNKVGVMATVGTVKSEAFVRELKKLNNEIKVFQNPCPHLVPIIESGKIDEESTYEILKDYLRPLIESDIDTLILGCTHYEILKDKIEELVERKVKIVSEGEITAKKLLNYLSKHSELDKRLKKNSCVKFFSTDLSKGFEEFGSRFFEKEFKATNVNLEL